MSNNSSRFQHFPLDDPEYREQVWQQSMELETLGSLLEDPHAWIFENTGRAPGQLLGERKDSMLIQFVYPTDGPPPGTIIVGGVVANNVLTVYMPQPSPDLVEDFRLLVDEEMQDTQTVLYDTLAYALHFPFEKFEQDRMLRLILNVLQAPAAYLDYLSPLLSMSGPQGGSISEVPAVPDRAARLQFDADAPSSVRFLFQWNRPDGEGKPRYKETRCLRLTGTYSAGALAQDGEETIRITVHTIVVHPEIETAPPPPPLPIGPDQEPPKPDPAPEETPEKKETTPPAGQS